jgi:hypothetical protein
VPGSYAYCRDAVDLTRRLSQISGRGQDSVALHRFTTHVMEMALLPFAFALGVNVYIPAVAINGTIPGAISGVTITPIVSRLAEWEGWAHPELLS